MKFLSIEAHVLGECALKASVVQHNKNQHRNIAVVLTMYYVLQEHTRHSSLKDNLSSHCRIPYSPEADAYCILLACSVNPKEGKHH